MSDKGAMELKEIKTALILSIASFLVFEDELSEDNQQSLLEIFAVILEELRKYCYLTLSPLQRSPRITLRGKRMDGYTDSNMLSLITI